MQFPRATPSRDVCAISWHRNPKGSANVLYRMTRVAVVTFGSTFTHATNAMMPAMLGRIKVTANHTPGRASY